MDSRQPGYSFRKTGAFVLFILFLASPASATGQVSSQTRDAGRPVLITPEWLGKNLSRPDILILQISTIERNFANAHIPGARFLWPGWLIVSNKNETNVPGEIKQMKKVLEGLGISNNSHIVLCGSAGNLLTVSRLFVTLSNLGLEGNLSILQGGFEAWEESGREVSSREIPFKKGRLILNEQDNLVNADWMLENLKNNAYRIIDARPKATFEGTPGTRQGHIPGAENMPASGFYDGKSWCFVPEETIIEFFKNLEIPAGVRPVFYCNTGNSASINFVAAVVAGFNPIIYDGSMEDWSSRLELPVETGVHF
jgi:thiosulfate/3-mercaptopyruvate sulfurtransferase